MAAGPKKSGPEKTATLWYLVAYNVISFALWVRIFLGTLLYLCTGSPQRKMFSGWFVQFLSKYTPTMITAPLPNFTQYHPIVTEMLVRAASLHDYIAPLVVFTQSLAVLEILHALLGMVRSGVFMTSVQVVSRLLVVWLVTEKYEAAAHSPFYATLVFAWSLSEVARYPFYVNQLLQTPSYMALWSRYSLFIVLYPLGVLSEMMLIYATLPHDQPWSWDYIQTWSDRDKFFCACLPLYIPGLFMLYTSLLKSRSRVLGNDFVGTKGRDEVRRKHVEKFEHIRRLHERE